jgi:hypothetical protein
MKEVCFMSNAGGIQKHSCTWFHLISPCILALALVLLAVPLHGQQTNVARFDAYVGYTFLDSPHVSLFENGFGAQFGVRPKTWFTVGVDYTYSRGDLSLTPPLLLPSLQATLGAELGQLAAAGLVPAGYSLVVPAHSVTQTFAAGPELVYRHMQHVTLFFRPVFLGVIHEAATPKPVDQIQTLVVGGFEQLGLVPPSGTKTNNVVFYGFGGGFDILINKHLGWRTQADLVYDHLFCDLLTDGRFTVRFSTGPCFNFGKNIVK